MTPDLHELKRILLVLMQRLRKHGLILNSEKCVLAVRSLMYIGHRVIGESVSSAEAKVQSIRNTASPKTNCKLCQY